MKSNSYRAILFQFSLDAMYFWQGLNSLNWTQYRVKYNTNGLAALLAELRICWLYPPLRCLPPPKDVLGVRQVADSDDDASVLVIYSVEYPFIAINPRSNLTACGCTCLDSIYRSNRSVWKWIIYDKTFCQNKKKNSIETALQKCNYEYSMNAIP